MPTYKITDPTTGKTVRLTGDTPPTEQELNDIFAKIHTAQPGPAPAPQPAAAVPQQAQGIPQGAKDAMLYGVPGVGPALSFAKNVAMPYAKAVGGAMQNTLRQTGQDIRNEPSIPMKALAGASAVPQMVFGDVLSPLFNNAYTKAAGGSIGSMIRGNGNRESVPWSGNISNTPQQNELEFAQQSIANQMAEKPEYQSRLNTALRLSNLVGMGLGAKAVPAAAQTAVKSEIKKSIGNMAEQNLNSAIEQGISKGVKPTVIGKKTLPSYDSFYEKAGDAVKTITENRGSIKLTDVDGNIIDKPKSAAQMAQAIDQTKKLIYKQYHDMAVAAGDNGASFDVAPIDKKLQAYTNDLAHSKANREYAKGQLESISELQGATPEVIESRIKELNESLDTYYKTGAGKERAAFDGSLAQAMRSQLDEQISGAVGEGYQGLKNKYGSLLAIEKEVNKRALVNARQNSKGLFDLTDVLSGGELAAGILSMNPALIGKSVAGWGIKELYKHINRPDRYIENMFKTTYKAIPENSIQKEISALPEVIEAQAAKKAATLKEMAEKAAAERIQFENSLINKEKLGNILSDVGKKPAIVNPELDASLALNKRISEMFPNVGSKDRQAAIEDYLGTMQAGNPNRKITQLLPEDLMAKMRTLQSREIAKSQGVSNKKSYSLKDMVNNKKRSK